MISNNTGQTEEAGLLMVTLCTAAAPAVRMAVEPELSYQNDIKMAIFFAANKNIDNVKVELASSKG